MNLMYRVSDTAKIAEKEIAVFLRNVCSNLRPEGLYSGNRWQGNVAIGW